MTRQQRLRRIAQIIELVDSRCMVNDGPIPPTLSEMKQEEISEIYHLACDENFEDKPIKCKHTCKKCKSENLKIVNSGPHRKLVCGDCYAYQKFISKSEAKTFNQLRENPNGV